MPHDDTGCCLPGFQESVVDAMLQISKAQALEFDTRQKGLELLIALCTNAPARTRRCGNAAQIMPVVFEIMCAADEDPDWIGGKYEDCIDEDEDFVAGDESMERILEALGKAMLPHALTIVREQVGSANWQCRRAALAIISRAADATEKAFRPHMLQAANFLMAALGDQHPRVKFQAIESVGRLSEVYGGEFQKATHAAVVPVLIGILSDPSQGMRLRGHAASAIINFANPSNCEAEYIEPYLDALLQALCTCLDPSVSPEVQEAALDGVSCVAQVTEADFSPYYGTFMPGLLGIATSAPAAGQAGQAVRGKALTCIGLVGDAVGKEVFVNDAQQLMQALAPIMQCPGGAFPEGYFEYYAPACARISKALGDVFVPYLPLVIPPLLGVLKAPVDNSMTELSEAEELAGLTQGSIADGIATTIVEVKGTKFKISLNTSAVLEKKTATQLLYEYAENMGRHMLDFIEPAAQDLIELVVFKFSEEVRCSACFALSKLFAAAVDAVKYQLRAQAFADQLLLPFTHALIENLKGEISAETRASSSESLRDILQACFESGGKSEDDASGTPFHPAVVRLPDANVIDTITKIMGVADSSMQRRQEKVNVFNHSEELDEDDQERLATDLEEEEELMTNLVDAIGYILKTLREQAVPIFDAHVGPAFAPLLTSDPTLRHNAMCLFDDMIEFGGAGAQKYLGDFLPVLCNNLNAEQSYLRQVSAYGIAQVAKVAPQHLHPVCQQIVPELVKLVQAQDSREDENILVTDNCVSAIGNIATHVVAEAEQIQLLRVWLNQLPLKGDEIEARVVHRQLCKLIEQNHPAVVGNQFEMLPVVLGIFATIFESTRQTDVAAADSLVDAPTMGRMRVILQQIQQALPAESLQAAWGQLSDGQRNAVQAALQG